ncbi:cytochrome c3 family protein [Pendulispora brunnea]|uniref:Cytochrome c3 family protein n=1 Tax=Pendulispora brunnea TaxID=2905690 RepID=A0ABZ2KA82_9BACT
MKPVTSFQALFALLGTVLVLDSMACEGDTAQTDVREESGTVTSTDTPIGLAFEIDNGVGVPLKVRRGQTFYIDQIDIRASIDSTVDEGISGLAQRGDFSNLDWRGGHLRHGHDHERDHHHHHDDEHEHEHDGNRGVDVSFSGEKNEDGTFTRRIFYRDFPWMRSPSTLTVEPIDAQGNRTGEPVVARIETGGGGEHDREHHDHDHEHGRDPSQNFFFTQRLRAIQWTRDCPTNIDCRNARRFSEEGLVELRYANRTNPTFKMQPNTVALRVQWSLKPAGQSYRIPITQVDRPNWDYGFGIDIRALTPPGANGTYAAGQKITFQFTLKDGAGKPLHAPGVMPSFQDFMNGNVESGIQYWRGFQEPNALYYRRKHREGHLNFAIVGPIQNNRATYDVVNIVERMDPTTGMLTTAVPDRGGLYGQATAVPSFAVIYGPRSGWANPSTDTWTFELPADAKPGTYYAVVKARRKYLGQELPLGKVVEFQVGSSQRTEYRPMTAYCENCHKNGGDLGHSLHGLDNRGTCTACHAPLATEMDNQLGARVHFIHSRTADYNTKIKKCGVCHLSGDRIERPSKGACLSCHRKYPSDHVRDFGPITDSYTGGGADAFVRCTDRCHRKHDD